MFRLRSEKYPDNIHTLRRYTLVRPSSTLSDVDCSCGHGPVGTRFRSCPRLLTVLGDDTSSCYEVMSRACPPPPPPPHRSLSGVTGREVGDRVGVGSLSCVTWTWGMLEETDCRFLVRAVSR